MDQVSLDLFNSVKRYSDIPAPSFSEEPVRQEILRDLHQHTDYSFIDEIGNTYVVKRGAKPGIVLLCAHQDKVLWRNPTFIATRKGNHAYALRGRQESFESLVEQGSLEGLCFSAGNKLVKGDITPTRPSPIESVRLKDLLERINRINASYDNSWINRREIKKAFLDWERSTAAGRVANYLRKGAVLSTNQLDNAPEEFLVTLWPECTLGQDGTIRGKLDDSAGLGIITYLTKVLDTETSPTILGLYTVREEVGSTGAERAAQNMRTMFEGIPVRAMVLDTTRFALPREGAVIYRSCGGVKFNPRYVEELVCLAEKNKINHRVVKPHTRNDSAVLGRLMPEVPTIAIEVPILGMHSREEFGSIEDVKAVYDLVSSYIGNGDFPLIDSRGENNG